jgi:antitoxin (DNA-binding transcriptional repressor) of toxin-antitoxin stability system
MKKPQYTEVPATQMNQAPGRLLDRVFRGEQIMLTRYGRPYVLLCPPPPDEEPAEPQSQSR